MNDEAPTSAGPGERMHARVEGRVQGVGFRWYVQQRAGALGLRGSVWNAVDGAVDVVAEGTPAALDALVRVLREGPPQARVHTVAVRREPASTADPLPEPFAIRRAPSC